MDIYVHFAGGQLEEKQHHRVNRWRKNVSVSLDQRMLDEPVESRGYRLLARVPRLPRPVAEQLVAHFGGLHKLLAASVAELQAVDGVAEPQARAVREGLSRLAEVTLLEKYS